MIARSVLAFVVLALASVAAFTAQDVQPQAGPSAEVVALHAAWSEALELDVPSEVLAAGAWIESAPQPEPVLAALYARALHAAGLDERADKLLAASEEAPLVLAAARFALDRDEIPRALALLAPKSGSAAQVRFPGLPECWLLTGRARARAGELARAEPLLMEFVKRDPWHVETPQAWFVLVDAARARGDAAEAQRREDARAKCAEWQAFYRARRLQVRANPKEPLPRLGLAQLWLAAGDLERARAAADGALALDAKFCRALEALAEIERVANRPAEARARIDAALACDPALVDVHLTRARLLRALGEADASAASYARYRELGGKKDL